MGESHGNDAFGDFNDVFRGMEESFQHMEEMFDLMNRGSTHISFPPLGGMDNFPDHPPQGESLRDIMLKEPDSAPSSLQPVQSPMSRLGSPSIPSDPSRAISGAKVDPSTVEQAPGQCGNWEVVEYTPNAGHWGWSWGTSSSIVSSVVTNSDGTRTIEERRTERDSSGNEVTTVKRSTGDQTHTVVTTVLPTGEQQVNESFNNIDQNAEPAFDRKFNRGNFKLNTWWPSPRAIEEKPLEDRQLDQHRSRIFNTIFGDREKQSEDHPKPTFFQRLFGKRE